MKKRENRIKINKVKLHKGDQVVVLIGKDKGRKGKVEEVIVKEGKVRVGGVNIFKKHLKPQGEGKPGGIVDIVKPLLISKVALVCPSCGKPTRIGFELSKNEKVRICRKCKAKV